MWTLAWRTSASMHVTMLSRSPTLRKSIWKFIYPRVPSFAVVREVTILFGHYQHARLSFLSFRKRLLRDHASGLYCAWMMCWCILQQWSELFVQMAKSGVTLWDSYTKLHPGRAVSVSTPSCIKALKLLCLVFLQNHDHLSTHPWFILIQAATSLIHKPSKTPTIYRKTWS